MDFYWLFDVTPVAHDDFFAVDQDSSANQLDIFQNDTDPNDDPIYIANLTSPQHGSITYSSDATTFQYTPDSGFYGVDSFTDSVTSGYGDVSSNATVTVFVNQSGNTPPSANDLIITLQTNVYSVTFNALTNASGNTPVLYAVNPASLGSVSNNVNGNVTYTRNPNLFGDDAFTYVLTDANGGYGAGNVKILQQDTSGDGLSDQWDLRYGFDPTVDNSMTDLSGDGLPNLAKFVLGLNPNVADNVLNLSSMTNGTPISGFAQLPIYGLNMSIPKPPIALWVNGLAGVGCSSRARTRRPMADGLEHHFFDQRQLSNSTGLSSCSCQLAGLDYKCHGRANNGSDKQSNHDGQIDKPVHQLFLHLRDSGRHQRHVSTFICMMTTAIRWFMQRGFQHQTDKLPWVGI